MNGFELYILGRKLMKIGEEAIPEGADFRRFPGSVRYILTDVFEHPGTSISEITERTGFPESHVSASVARLCADNFVETLADPAARHRMIIRSIRRISSGPTERATASVEGPLAAALGGHDQGDVAELVATLESLARRFRSSRRPDAFDTRYIGTCAAWDIERPQPAFLQLARDGAIKGRVLDVGCGTGEHALLAAHLGLSAVGIDTASAAVAIAERKARDHNLEARFRVWDALNLAELGEQFDTVLDCGLFHVFDDEDRVRFVDNLRAVIAPGGRYFVLCCSDQRVAGNRPRRVTKDELRASFADGWRIDAIDAAIIDLAARSEGMSAWRAAVTRT
jgi:SAM-dependent methyltransferase